MENKKTTLQTTSINNQSANFSKQEIKNHLSNRLFGYELKLDIRSSFGANQHIEFYFDIDRDKVDDLYNKIRNDSRVNELNFSGNPYNKNSYISIIVNDCYYTIGAPKGINGDNDWMYYKRCKISIVVDKKK